jgi:hypothetical protein
MAMLRLKNTPVALSPLSLPPCARRVISTAASAVTGSANQSGSLPSSRPSATPAKALCASPSPKKAVRRWTMNTPR